MDDESQINATWQNTITTNTIQSTVHFSLSKQHYIHSMYVRNNLI